MLNCNDPIQLRDLVCNQKLILDRPKKKCVKTLFKRFSKFILPPQRKHKNLYLIWMQFVFWLCREHDVQGLDLYPNTCNNCHIQCILNELRWLCCRKLAHQHFCDTKKKFIIFSTCNEVLKNSQNETI